MAANKSAFDKIHWLNGRATGYYGPREYAEARVAEEGNFTYYDNGKLVTLDHDQSVEFWQETPEEMRDLYGRGVTNRRCHWMKQRDYFVEALRAGDVSIDGYPLREIPGLEFGDAGIFLTKPNKDAIRKARAAIAEANIEEAWTQHERLWQMYHRTKPFERKARHDALQAFHKEIRKQIQALEQERHERRAAEIRATLERLEAKDRARDVVVENTDVVEEKPITSQLERDLEKVHLQWFAAPAETALVPQDSMAAAILEIEDNYSYHIRQFVDWLNGRPLTKETVVDYVRELNDSDYRAATKRVKRQALKKRLRQLQELGELGSEWSERMEQFLTDLDRRDGTKAPKINSTAVPRDKILEHRDYQKLVRLTASSRQKLFMRFLWTTGCRVSEMTGIKLRDCETEQGVVTITIMGKGSKEREIRIPEGLYDEIRAVFGGSTWLFETSRGKPYTRGYVSGEIAKIGKRHLGRKISAHTFRHSFATKMIQRTADIQGVSEYLGHSSPSITLAIYTHTGLKTEDLFADEVSA